MAGFFDFHLHPSYKPFLTDLELDKKDHCWTTYNNIIGIIKSQSSLEQMQAGNMKLAVTCIYTTEKQMTTSFLLRYIAPKVTMLDEEMFASIPGANYFDRFMEQIEHYEKSANMDADRRFNFVNNASDMKEDHMNVILAIEGSHSLEKGNEKLTDNLIKLKNYKHRFFYLTLTHATQFPVCTHAYAMKLIKHNDQFKPKGFGFTDLGKELIDVCYDTSLGNRIFVDVKHMSLVTRKQFYDLRKEKGYENIPLVATHMGFTGISWEPESIKEYIKDKAVNNRGFVQVLYERPRGIGQKGILSKKSKTHFNPWSLNLYNEEIPIILESNGLIGISLDQRILGFAPVKGEFYDEKEFKAIMGELIPMEEGDFLDESFDFVEEEPVLTERESFLNKRRHLRYFCNQILHIVKHGGEKAWKHMCLGSDFDGLIDPINNCTSCAQYDKLEEDTVRMLKRMIKEAKKEEPGLNFHEGDLTARVRDIMYNNAFEFFKTNF